jgi:hypothetical protein
MVVVFAAFVALKFVFVQQLGPGLARGRAHRRHAHPQRAAARVHDRPRGLELVTP